MGERSGIQLVPMQSPLRQGFVHDRHEPVVMVPLQQMHQFVDDKIFQALHRLFHQFEVQPDTAGLDVAGAPLGFHLFDTPLDNLNPQDRLPFLQQRRDQDFQLLAIPSLQHPFAPLGTGFRLHMEFQRGFVSQHDSGRPRLFSDTQAVAPPPQIVTFAADHLALGLARLGLEPGPLALDPAELPDDRQPYGIIGHRQRRRHPHAAVRRVDAEVQVLNGLPDDGNFQAADGDLAVLSISAVSA